MKRTLIIGTRKSKMALWQTEWVKQLLERGFPGVDIQVRHIVTLGDRTQETNQPMPEIGGKGLFTAELEAALRDRSIDLAVHSLKDLPTKVEPEFAIGAVCPRGLPWDVLLSVSGKSLVELPPGTVIGTSSVRRSAQILRLRSDLRIEHIRGNADTRIMKLHKEELPYGAILLAHAGLERLGMLSHVTQTLNADEMLPAPGQGAVAVQCRSDDSELLSMLRFIHHEPTNAEVTAERAFLARLDAGCNTPVAALGRCVNTGGETVLALRGRCLATDGSRAIEVATQGRPADAAKLGRELAEEAISRGFFELDAELPMRESGNG